MKIPILESLRTVLGIALFFISSLVISIEFLSRIVAHLWMFIPPHPMAPGKSLGGLFSGAEPGAEPGPRHTHLAPDQWVPALSLLASRWHLKPRRWTVSLLPPFWVGWWPCSGGDLTLGFHAAAPSCLSDSSCCLDFSFVLDSNLVQVHVLQLELKVGGLRKASKMIFEEHACF